MSATTGPEQGPVEASEGRCSRRPKERRVTGIMPVVERSTDPDTDETATTGSADIGGTSGDPLLKRLVELSKVGWEADLVLFSNGTMVRGRLISGVKFRAALAESIVERRPSVSSNLDAIVAQSVAAEDPPPEQDDNHPEPRFIHLAEVEIGHSPPIRIPFLRLRLPAVSGFWIESTGRGAPNETG